MNQTIRIIGGRYRGKKLTFPEANSLRPTPNRIKETLFNWLMPFIQGAACLDMFAGSGSLGFEAYSRGAKSVVFLERNPEVHRHLKKEASSFLDNQFSIILSDAFTFLNQTKECFDIVFLDPPFATDYLVRCLDHLGKSPVLNEDGLVYVESSSAISPDPVSFEVLKSKKAGQVYYGLLRKKPSSGMPS